MHAPDSDLRNIRRLRDNTLQVSNMWKTLRSYILWTHERGSLHYDVMVTLILAFIFLTPLWFDFKDKPAERIPHPSEIVVAPAENGFVYEFDLPAELADQGNLRATLRRAIEPVSGEVEVLDWSVVRQTVKSTTYRVRARRM